jgi:hypothetical protein
VAEAAAIAVHVAAVVVIAATANNR